MSNKHENLVPSSIDSWCKTKCGDEVKFRYAWTIEKFIDCCQVKNEKVR